MFSSEFKFYLLLPLLFLVAFFFPGWGRGFFRWVESLFTRLAHRPWLALVVVGAVGFAAGAVPALIQMPAPKVHDEFSHLLVADTFVHGRLTNPTPSLWQHFETIHVILVPTYTSKFQPGQGAALALGQLLWRPILGVWMSTAFACAAVCWMLQGWLPPRWALLGGILVGLHPQIITWAYGYWGGAAAMAGGALVCGGMRRIVETRRKGAWALGAGLLILAMSRPYEGFVVSVLVIGSGAILIGKADRSQGREVIRHCGGPLALSAAVIVSIFCMYNYRVTGHPLRPPYAEHESQYVVAPIFLGQSFRPEPVYGHREIRNFHLHSDADLRGARDGLVSGMIRKLHAQAQGWLWMGLWVPPLAVGFWRWRRDVWLRVAAVGLGGMLVALLVGQGIFPHYAAPAAGLFFFVIMQGGRQLHAWGRRQGIGAAFVRWLCLLCICTVPAVWWRLLEKNKEGWFRDRERVLAKLGAMPGKQLVFMRYSAAHNPNREWVFNEADLQNSKVLWSREMTMETDQQVIDFYKERTVWVVEPDQPHPEPVPYFPKAPAS